MTKPEPTNKYRHNIIQCVSENKRHRYYICGNFDRCRPILLIFSRNIPEEICSMTVITYLLKSW